MYNVHCTYTLSSNLTLWRIIRIISKISPRYLKIDFLLNKFNINCKCDKDENKKFNLPDLTQLILQLEAI